MIWKSIKSAPRNGTYILVWWGNRNHYSPTNNVGIVFWEEGEWRDPNTYLDCQHPTHWMPLPKPPAAASKGAGDG